MTDSKWSGNSALRSKLRGIKSADVPVTAFAQKKSAGLAPGATFGPVKNLDVLTVDQNPESRPSRCSATFIAKEMPLTKHLIYRDSKSYFLVNFVRKLDTNTDSNHPLLNHWLDSRFGQRKCKVSCHFFIKPSNVANRMGSVPILHFLLSQLLQ
jgi:hypothetical protein